jgi:hypothetical protein
MMVESLEFLAQWPVSEDETKESQQAYVVVGSQIWVIAKQGLTLREVMKKRWEAFPRKCVGTQ